MSQFFALAMLPAVLAASGSGYVKLAASKSSSSGSDNVPVTFEDSWLDGQGGYFADIAIGSSAQPLKVLLDTGSANLWVPSSNAATCRNYTCPAGAFNSQSSKSYSVVTQAPKFHIQYADGSDVQGVYAKDDVTLGSANLSAYEFALANIVQVSPGVKNGAQYGIMGVSFDGQESGACPDGDCSSSYITPTVVDALYSAGAIGSRSYSLYLDDVVEQKGSILFGAVDTAKFSGDLVTLATIKHPSAGEGDPQVGQYVEQGLYLTSCSISANGSTTAITQSGYSNPILLDSGAGSISLPKSVFDAVVNAIPSDLVIVYQQQLAAYCDQSSYDFDLSLGLTGADGKSATVDVPFRELLVPLYASTNYNSTTFAKQNGRTICLVNLNAGSDGEQLTLGDPLLRSAYVFYNLDEKSISIAKPSYYSSSSKIVAVGSGGTPSMSGSGSDSINEGNVLAPASATGTAGYAAPTATSTATGAASSVRVRLPMLGSFLVGYISVAFGTLMFGML